MSRGERNKPTSKYFGVCFLKRENKWLAKSKQDGHTKIIAVCNDELSAARAYANWAKPQGKPYTLVAL
jgi:hypothetical protein